MEVAKKGDLESFLTDFIFAGHRLGAHPEVIAALLLKEEQDTWYGQKPALWVDFDTLARGSLRHKERMYFLSNDLRVPSFEDNMEEYRVRRVGSFIAVPLLQGVTTTGTLCVHSFAKHYFQERHLRSAQLLATLLSYVHTRSRSRQIIPDSVALGRVLKSARQDLGITQAELARRLSQSTIAISRWEAGAQPPSAGPLYKWCQALGLVALPDRAIVRVVDISPRILSMLREDPQGIKTLSPEQFEYLVAERLDRMGFDVTMTGATSSKDGGIDIVAIPRARTFATFLIATQVKHHRGEQKTGREAVDRLLAWKDTYFRVGLLVTNTSFTADARWVARQQNNRSFLRLRDFWDLKRWLEDNFSSSEELQEIPQEVVLAPGITVAIPEPKLKIIGKPWPLGEELP